MPDIHIERRHALGLPLARQIARRWTRKLESDFSLQCRYEEGAKDDQVAVSGPGVAGWVVVNARFLQVQLDLRFPLITLRSMLERRIASELDEALQEHAARKAAARKPARAAVPRKAAAAKPAARKTAPQPAARKPAPRARKG
ncbi:polyhydroxyalkanoic acid system family protein [Ottowia sp.]|uniref:polyhydroxyalkanoic acid system family protein n=1 Tax=Ottowia sp. TaxID=1898956 RepID=UPI0039E4F4A4